MEQSVWQTGSRHVSAGRNRDQGYYRVVSAWMDSGLCLGAVEVAQTTECWLLFT